MSFLTKLFKRKHEKQYIESDNSYLYSQVVYNGNYNFIILLSFTEDKFFDAIELIYSFKYINAIFSHSAYEEDYQNDTDNDDFSIKPIILNKKYYILVSGNDKDYVNFINNSNMQNKFVKIIIDEILAYRKTNDYKSLIDNEYLNSNDFSIDKGHNLSFDNIILYSDNVYGDDINKIRTKLPESFTQYDIINILKVYNKNENYEIAEYKLYDIYKYRQTKYNSIYNLIMKNDYVLKNIFGNNYQSYMIDNLLKPVYLQLDSEDMKIGSISDESLDEIFKVQYERFSAVYDETINYEDIDEVISSENISDNSDDEEGK